jgi:hypothetical protein
MARRGNGRIQPYGLTSGEGRVFTYNSNIRLRPLYLDAYVLLEEDRIVESFRSLDDRAIWGLEMGLEVIKDINSGSSVAKSRQ